MGTAIQHPLPDRVKQSFVIFDIWLNPVWHRMLYSCTDMETVDVKGLSDCFGSRLGRAQITDPVVITVIHATLSIDHFHSSRRPHIVLV